MADRDPNRHPDGHVLLDGARWHYPAKGSPTTCAVPGCERVLGQQQHTAIEADDEVAEAVDRAA